MGRRRRVKLPAEPQTAVIDNMSHDGRGIARIDGKTTFIHGALSGERVDFIYKNKKKQYDEGECLEVHQASPLRVVPSCEHFSVCGACSLQHMAPAAQIAMKQRLLLEQIERAAGCFPQEVLEPIVGDSDSGYRGKARLSARYVEKKASALVGFRERGNGRFIADIERCAILVPEIGERIRLCRDFIGTLEGRESIAQIEVAMGEPQGVLIFRNLQDLSEQDKKRLAEFSTEIGLTIYLQPGGTDTIQTLDGQCPVPLLSYVLPAYDLRMHFHPNDFTQVNVSVNQKMIAHALDCLQPEATDRVLDLFCGLGNFSLPLAKTAAEVIGVEGCEAMVGRASFNAEFNGIDNASFYTADLSQSFEAQAWAQGGFDKILLDPPRSGAREVVENIHYFNAKKIVYVSCDPATLARDTAILVNQQGYTLVAAGVMDMFPHTAHVESIALFER